jgi:hypothetical protein
MPGATPTQTVTASNSGWLPSELWVIGVLLLARAWGLFSHEAFRGAADFEASGSGIALLHHAFATPRVVPPWRMAGRRASECDGHSGRSWPIRSAVVKWLTDLQVKPPPTIALDAVALDSSPTQHVWIIRGTPERRPVSRLRPKRGRSPAV